MVFLTLELIDFFKKNRFIGFTLHFFAPLSTGYCLRLHFFCFFVYWLSDLCNNRSDVKMLSLKEVTTEHI